ncbi:ESPR-type extended signal peptide-containing protein [Paraburkholderia bannensis]|uniref:ESPR-type extended signal peptide-containing protein n=1 Tax=Paraburkholderia bannensis TaxID=765414 RepID=UPI002AB700DB|nr:ESPR-type extended signal peptide-containing protein [Paraburkholderia bannensis]
MNKAYRSVWNDATGTWVAVQENACGRSKQSRSNSKVLAVASSGVAAVAALMAAPAYAGSNTVALFNDGVDNGCSAIYDNWSTSNWTDARCSVSLGNAGTAVSIGMNSTNGTGSNSINLISNMAGLFVNGGLEVFGTGVSSGSPAAYIHGGLSLFSGGTTSGTANKLIGLANGTVSAASTDAVNGSQLFGLANSTATALGGGSVVNVGGTVSAPSYALTNANAIDGTTGAAQDIGSAFNTVDAALGKLNSAITNMSGGVVPDAVMYDSSAHSSVTLGGTGASSAVALHNVANGALNASSLDAVNGSQLYATNTNVSNLAGNVTTMQGSVSTLSGNVTTINGQITSIQGKLADAVLYDSSAHNSVTLGGTGASSAVALHNVANGALNVSSLDAVNGSQLYATNTNVSNLAGTYGGESALALGANWYVSDRVLLNAHVSRATGSGAGTGASVGATIGF